MANCILKYTTPSGVEGQQRRSSGVEIFHRRSLYFPFLDSRSKWLRHPSTPLRVRGGSHCFSISRLPLEMVKTPFDSAQGHVALHVHFSTPLEMDDSPSTQ